MRTDASSASNQPLQTQEVDDNEEPRNSKHAPSKPKPHSKLTRGLIFIALFSSLFYAPNANRTQALNGSRAPQQKIAPASNNKHTTSSQQAPTPGEIEADADDREHNNRISTGGRRYLKVAALLFLFCVAMIAILTLIAIPFDAIPSDPRNALSEPWRIVGNYLKGSEFEFTTIYATIAVAITVSLTDAINELQRINNAEYSRNQEGALASQQKMHEVTGVTLELGGAVAGVIALLMTALGATVALSLGEQAKVATYTLEHTKNLTAKSKPELEADIRNAAVSAWCVAVIAIFLFSETVRILASVQTSLDLTRRVPIGDIKKRIYAARGSKHPKLLSCAWLTIAALAALAYTGKADIYGGLHLPATFLLISLLTILWLASIGLVKVTGIEGIFRYGIDRAISILFITLESLATALVSFGLTCSAQSSLGTYIPLTFDAYHCLSQPVQAPIYFALSVLTFILILMRGLGYASIGCFRYLSFEHYQLAQLSQTIPRSKGSRYRIPILCWILCPLIATGMAILYSSPRADDWVAITLSIIILLITIIAGFTIVRCAVIQLQCRSELPNERGKNHSANFEMVIFATAAILSVSCISYFALKVLNDFQPTILGMICCALYMSAPALWTLFCNRRARRCTARIFLALSVDAAVKSRNERIYESIVLGVRLLNPRFREGEPERSGNASAEEIAALF